MTFYFHQLQGCRQVLSGALLSYGNRLAPIYMGNHALHHCETLSVRKTP